MEQESKGKKAASTWNAWLRPPGLIFLMVIGALLVVDLILVGYPYAWTGFGERKLPSGGVVYAKTLWDWLELIIVPATLGIGGYLLNNAQQRREDVIAETNTQETTLHAYFNEMSTLLFDNKLSLEPTEGTKGMARLWTLTAVRRVNGDRKGIVLRFLHEAELIQGSEPVVILEGADFSGAQLTLAKLQGVNLSGVNLSNADLQDADLSRAILSAQSRFHDEVFATADLSEANLEGANLSEADLSGVKYDVKTVWPDGFASAQVGAKLVELA